MASFRTVSKKENLCLWQNSRMGKRNFSWRIIWKFKSKLRNHWQLWEITWRFSRFTWSFGNDAYWLTIKKGIQRKHPTVYSEFLYFFVSEWAPRPLMRRLDISNIPFSLCPSPSSFLLRTVLHPWRERLLNGWDPCEVWCFVFWSWAVLFYFAFC